MTNLPNSSDICGNCTMCCKVLGINDKRLSGEHLVKPAGTWCKHCAIGTGCKVYEDRPAVCRDFQCLYLQGVLHGETLSPDLRPDHCGVVISATTDGHLAASMDPHKPDAWRHGEVFKLIKHAVRAGVHVTISTGNTKMKKILKRAGKRTSATRISDPHGRIEVYELEFSEPDERGMQWSVEETGKLVEMIDA